MIWINSKVSKEERFASRLVTATIRLDSDKYGVDLRQCLGIVTFQDPSFFGVVVLVENTEA